jgi:hypothetical protein
MKRGHKSPFEKLILVWTCRNVQSFKWFQEQLMALETLDYRGWIEIRLFWSVKRVSINTVNQIVMNHSEHRDVLTGLRVKTFFGRPDWARLLGDVQSVHENFDMGVFACGPVGLTDQLDQICRTLALQSMKTKVDFFSEHF